MKEVFSDRVLEVIKKRYISELKVYMFKKCFSCNEFGALLPHFLTLITLCLIVKNISFANQEHIMNTSSTLYGDMSLINENPNCYCTPSVYATSLD